MRSKTDYMHLAGSLFMSACLFLAACQGSNQDIKARTAKLGPAGSDSVKGLAKMEKEVESYAWSVPTASQDYKDKLSSIFAKLSADTGTSWEALFKVKNWYKGPETIKDKFSNPISLTSTENAKYIAQQTQYQVWIEMDLFKELNTDQKAKLILRQYLISLYTLKNLDDNELCATMKTSLNVKECVKTASAEMTEEAKDKTDESTEELAANKKQTGRKQEAPRKVMSDKTLLDADKAVIEQIAKEIETAGDKVNGKELLQSMKAKGFNTAVFEYKIAVDTTNTTQDTPGTKLLTSEVYLDLIEQMKLAANQDLFCTVPGSTEKPVSCTVSLKELASEAAGKIYSLDIKKQDKIIASDSIVVKTGKSVYASLYTDKVANLDLIIVPLNNVSLPKDQQVVGGTFRNEHLAAVMQDGKYKFVGVISIPGKITAVSDECTAETAITEAAPAVMFTVSSMNIDAKWLTIKPWAACQ